jgi:hypothetical protein
VAFVTKLDPSGSSLAYSTYLGGSLVDTVNGIAVDSQGATYVTGDTESADFPTTADSLDSTYADPARPPHRDPSSVDPRDTFVTKLQPTGSDLAYSTFLGGSYQGGAIGHGIAVDSGGAAAYIVGDTDDPEFPTTTGAFDTSGHADSVNFDAFVAKLAFASPGTSATTATQTKVQLRLARKALKAAKRAIKRGKKL